MKVTSHTGPITELDQLAAAAEYSDQEQSAADAGQGAPGEAPPPAPMTNTQVLIVAMELIRETLCTVAQVKSPRDTASSDKLQPLADAWGAVCDKRGIQLADMVGDYILEFKALALSVPLILAAHKALQLEIISAKKSSAAAPASNVVPLNAANDGTSSEG